MLEEIMNEPDEVKWRSLFLLYTMSVVNTPPQQDISSHQDYKVAFWSLLKIIHILIYVKTILRPSVSAPICETGFVTNSAYRIQQKQFHYCVLQI
jgi:hypothetical protein